MGNHVPRTPLETLGSIYIRSALEFRNLENTTVRDQCLLTTISRAIAINPEERGGEGVQFHLWQYLQNGDTCNTVTS